MSQVGPTLLTFGGVAFLFMGLVIVFLGWRAATADDVSRRLQEFVAPDAAAPLSRPRPQYLERELSGSLGKRLILPGFQRLGRLFGRLTPAGVLDDLRRQLAIAGSPLGLGPREFYGLRLLFNLLGLWLGFNLLRQGFTQINLIYALLAYIICNYLPKSWLKRRVRARQERVRRGLPDALDMLSVCAEAGLGFDQSLQRVSEHWKTPLGAEFGRVVADMEMGSSRQQALRSLAERLDVSELSGFVAVILQSDQLGMSIADTLRAQALQMREERRFRAQEQARKIPLKMLFPILFFILPALFVVVLGPSIPAIMDFFASLNTQ
jgi:tight adherence protein C